MLVRDPDAGQDEVPDIGYGGVSDALPGCEVNLDAIAEVVGNASSSAVDLLVAEVERATSLGISRAVDRITRHVCDATTSEMVHLQNTNSFTRYLPYLMSLFGSKLYETSATSSSDAELLLDDGRGEYVPLTLPGFLASLEGNGAALKSHDLASVPTDRLRMLDEYPDSALVLVLVMAIKPAPCEQVMFDVARQDNIVGMRVSGRSMSTVFRIAGLDGKMLTQTTLRESQGSANIWDRVPPSRLALCSIHLLRKSALYSLYDDMSSVLLETGDGVTAPPFDATTAAYKLRRLQLFVGGPGE